IEEAYAYKNLINELDIRQEDLANKLGKSRSHIANTMRLLSLPEDIIIHISSGELTMGHGRALLGLKDKTKLKHLVKKIRKEHLNVRQVENMITTLNNTKKISKKQSDKKDVFLTEQEKHLREHLGTNVAI